MHAGSLHLQKGITMPNGYNTNPCQTYSATAAVTAFRAVSLVASTGYIQHAGAGDTPIGTVEATSASSTAARNVEVRLFNAPGTRTMVASAAVTQFAPVYVGANGKISGTANGVCVGIAMEAATADGDEIEVLTGCNHLFSQGTIYKAVANGSAINTTSTETVVYSATIPANSLKVGDEIRVYGVIYNISVNATPTLRGRIRFGGTTLTGTAVSDTSTISVIADNWLILNATIQIQAIGASGSFVASGQSNSIANTTNATQSIATAATTIDTTAAILVELTALWSASHLSNSCRGQQFTVKKNA